MKKFLFMVLLLACVLPVAALADPQLQFCESFDDKLKPVNPGTSFPGPAVSWVINNGAPFGKPAMVVTLYERNGGRETLISREKAEINPLWNAYGMRNMALPKPGEYSLALTTENGTPIASAQVAITEAQSEEPPKPEEKVGATLEEIFKKYAPKK